MRNPISIVRKACTTALLFLLGRVALMAQTQDVSAMLNITASTLKSAATSLINVVSIIIGGVALVQLVPTYAKHSKGEPTSADAFLKNGGGLLLSVLFIQLIRILLLS